MKIKTKMLILITISAFVGACGSDKTSSATTTTTTSETYYTSDDLCYQSSDGTEVSADYCDGTDDYYLTENGCYQESDGVAVESTTYCNTATTDSSTTGACSGTYLWYSKYGDEWEVSCDGVANTGNCSGYILYKKSTGARTVCK
jgi:hypothetical protein